MQKVNKNQRASPYIYSKYIVTEWERLIPECPEALYNQRK